MRSEELKVMLQVLPQENSGVTDKPGSRFYLGSSHSSLQLMLGTEHGWAWVMALEALQGAAGSQGDSLTRPAPRYRHALLIRLNHRPGAW